MDFTLVTAEEAARILDCTPPNISLYIDPVAVTLSSDRTRRMPLFALRDVEQVNLGRSKLDHLPVLWTVTAVSKVVGRSPGRVMNEQDPTHKYQRRGKVYPLFSQQAATEYFGLILAENAED